MHEKAAAVNGEIVTEDGDYDHRRLTTIYTDHDLPEHDASNQPAALHRSPLERQCESKAPQAPLIETRNTQEFDGQLTAFVLSVGGSLGALQIGMLHALLEAGIRPDLVVSTPIGALNAAFLAGYLGLDDIKAMTEFWPSVQRRDVFRKHQPGPDSSPFLSIRSRPNGVGALPRIGIAVRSAGLRNAQPMALVPPVDDHVPRRATGHY